MGVSWKKELSKLFVSIHSIVSYIFMNSKLMTGKEVYSGPVLLK